MQTSRGNARTDSNRNVSRPGRTRTPVQDVFRALADARRDVIRIAKDHSPAAMLRICEMGGLVDGVEPATSEAIRFAACVEVMNRAHGRPNISVGDANAQPLVVDFRWQDEPAPRLIEAGPGD